MCNWLAYHPWTTLAISFAIWAIICITIGDLPR